MAGIDFVRLTESSFNVTQWDTAMKSVNSHHTKLMADKSLYLKDFFLTVKCNTKDDTNPLDYRQYLRWNKPSCDESVTNVIYSVCTL